MTFTCSHLLLFVPDNQEYIELLMTPLIAKWNSLSDEDDELFPLLEVWMLLIV